MSEKYLKASEVAEKLKVNPYTVKGWIRNGYFPNAKLEETVAGSIWLIPECDLKEFVKPERGRPSKISE